jgi:hypothetical protein
MVVPLQDAVTSTLNPIGLRPAGVDGWVSTAV